MRLPYPPRHGRHSRRAHRGDLNRKNCADGRHCVAAARNALESIDGVSVEKIWIGRALIITDDFDQREGKIKAALTEEGYPLVSAQAL